MTARRLQLLRQEVLFSVLQRNLPLRWAACLPSLAACSLPSWYVLRRALRGIFHVQQMKANSQYSVQHALSSKSKSIQEYSVQTYNASQKLAWLVLEPKVWL